MTNTILLQSNVQHSHTGDTAKTTLVDYTLPANTLGANGSLRITTSWSRSGTNAAATDRIDFGGTTISSGNFGTGETSKQCMTILNANNSTSAQKVPQTTMVAAFPNAATPMTLAVDTTAAVHIIASTQLNNAADTVSLESILIEQIEP